MSKIMEKFNVQLKDFLSSLQNGEAKRTRKMIAEACRVPTRRVYNWTNAGIKISALERETIKKVLHKDIFI